MSLEFKNKVQTGDVILRTINVERVFKGIRLEEITYGEKRKERKGINCKYFMMIEAQNVYKNMLEGENRELTSG